MVLEELAVFLEGPRLPKDSCVMCTATEPHYIVNDAEVWESDKLKKQS